MVFVVLSQPGPSVDGYVVHVDGHASFVNEILEDHVHHCLEGSWGVSQTEEYDRWFVQPFIGYKGCLSSVLWFDEDFIISPFNVEACEQCAVS